jgi:NAD(P)H-dependent FMN reductase
VSYRAASGSRAVEQLRLVMAELRVADVRSQVLLSVFTNFEDYTTFKPAASREAEVNRMIDDVVTWGVALKPLRAPLAQASTTP